MCFFMYFKRNLEDTIIKHLPHEEIIAVVGQRRSGKTTMLSKIINNLGNSISISFEARESLDLFENNLKKFIKKFVTPYKYLFIDEFQYAKNGGQKLKYIFDMYLIFFIIVIFTISSIWCKNVNRNWIFTIVNLFSKKLKILIISG